MWAREHAELADYLARNSCRGNLCGAASCSVPSPLSGEFSDRFAAHLAEFGHTLYDLDFAKPIPADDPLPLVEALKAYLEGKGANPHERQQNQMERREQAEQAIAKRLGPLRRKWFLKLLNQAQDTAPDAKIALRTWGWVIHNSEDC